MKKIIPLLLLLISTSAFARNENKIVGNGGDVYALQFVSIASKIHRYLEAQPDKPDFDLQRLDDLIDVAKVESTDKPLELKGLPKDAINYPSEKRIVLNRARWDAITSAEKSALVFHEYLGLMGVEGASYKYSKALFSAGLEFEIIQKYLAAANEPSTEIGKIFKAKRDGQMIPEWSLEPSEDLQVTLLNSYSGEGSNSGDAFIVKLFRRPFAGGQNTSALVIRASYSQEGERTNTELKVSEYPED